MRRIAVAALMLVALAAAYWACSTDAPAPTPPTKGGGPQASPLVITLFTTNANPTAGSCTLIQAVVTLNGKAVDDGTGVSFSTDFGTFAQNGQPVVSVVTQKGSAFSALCSNLTGTAFVNASATVGGVTGKAEPLKIVFQSSVLQLPFFTGCSPSFAANTGGAPLTISGGRFPGDVTTTRVTFTAAGVTREGLVTSVTPTAVVVTTPAFPEAIAPSVPVAITLTFLANSASPITLAVPNCFAFGTAAATTPTITALLPSSGTNDGNTRVSVIGSGFAAPLQVFFGPAEAQVISISFNQIVVLSPRASTTASTVNATVPVRVHEVTSGVDGTFTGFRYTEPVQIISFSNNVQRIDQPFTTVTIFGRGFEAPVAVSLAGFAAFVTSVSATEIQVIPSLPVFDCAKGDITGPIAVVNINTGDGTSGGSFTYVVKGTVPCFTPTPTITPLGPTPTPPPPADLEVTKTAQPSTVASGSNVTFGIVIHNIGGSTANAVTVTDTLPAGTSFVSCSSTQGSCSGTTTITVSPGPISPGGFVNVSIVVNVTAAGPSSVTNTASASTTSPEPNLANNTSSATVTVTP